MSSKELAKKTLNRQHIDRIVFDIGSTTVSGIHVQALTELSEYYGFRKKRVRIIELFQMLGKVESELAEIIGIDRRKELDFWEKEVNRAYDSVKWVDAAFG